MPKGYSKVSGKPTWHKTKYRKKAAATRAKRRSYTSRRSRTSSLSNSIARSVVRLLFK